MRRYWNGHQWRELPESTGDGTGVDQRNGSAAQDGPAPAAQAIAQESPMIPGEAEEAPKTLGETEEAPTTSGAITVATHAEYGDVFTAIAASLSAETERP